MARTAPQISIEPGNGLIGRFGDTVILIPRGALAADRADQTARELLDLAVAVASDRQSPASMIAARLAAWVVGHMAEDVTAFGIVVPVEDGVVMFLRGAVWGSVTERGFTHQLSGEQALTWVDQLIPGTFDQLAIGGTADQPVQADPLTDLRDGVVPGQGFVLSRLPSAPAPVASDADSAPAAWSPPPAAASEAAPSVAEASSVPASSSVVEASSAPASSSVAESSYLGEAPFVPASSSVAEASSAPEATPSWEDAPSVPEASSVPEPAPSWQEASSVPEASPSWEDAPSAPEASSVPEPAPSWQEASSVPEAAPSWQDAPSAPEASSGPEGPSARHASPLKPSWPGAAQEPEPLPSAGAPEPPPYQATEIWNAPADDPYPVDARTPDAVAEQAPAPLGVLTSANGLAIVLDRTYVLGRDPHRDPAVESGAAAPILMQDPDNVISRVHAHVYVENGLVMVRDASSLDGTYISPPGGDEWTRIGAEPSQLPPRWSMRIGGQVLTYNPAGSSDQR